VTLWRIYRYKPDAVILQWWTTFWAPVWFVLGILQRIFVRKALLIICHNVLPHETRWWDALLARSVLRWGSTFTVQSVEEERRLHSLLPGAKTTVVPLPVFDMFADQRVSQEEARKLLGLPLDAPVLLFFGIVREYKGLQDVLAALPKVQAQVGRVVLVVAGEFWDDKQPYLDTIERLEIGQLVIIKDCYIPNEDVALFFSAADVLVAPYRAKTGSGVIQMAKGFGIAIITTRVGGLSELTAERDAGLLVMPGDTSSLADAICRYSEGGMSGRGQAVIGATEQDSWDRMVCAIEVLAQNG
jgi:glycosyltransferase involved in cell wall biosynthesis